MWGKIIFFVTIIEIIFFTSACSCIVTHEKGGLLRGKKTIVKFYPNILPKKDKDKDKDKDKLDYAAELENIEEEIDIVELNREYSTHSFNWQRHVVKQ